MNVLSVFNVRKKGDSFGFARNCFKTASLNSENLLRIDCPTPVQPQAEEGWDLLRGYRGLGEGLELNDNIGAGKAEQSTGGTLGGSAEFPPLRDGYICTPHPAPAFLPPSTDSAAAAGAFHPGQNNRYPSSQASHPLIPSIIPSLHSRGFQRKTAATQLKHLWDAASGCADSARS